MYTTDGRKDHITPISIPVKILVICFNHKIFNTVPGIILPYKMVIAIGSCLSIVVPVYLEAARPASVRGIEVKPAVRIAESPFESLDSNGI